MRYNLQDYAYELNKEAAALAKKSAEKYTMLKSTQLKLNLVLLLVY